MAGRGHRPGRGMPLRPVRPVYLSRPKRGTVTLRPTVSAPLRWSFTVGTSVPVTTVTTNDVDRWNLTLEWAFLLNVEPVEDPPV